MKKIVMIAFQSHLMKGLTSKLYVHRKLIKQILSKVGLLIPHTIKVSRLYQTE